MHDCCSIVPLSPDVIVQWDYRHKTNNKSLLRWHWRLDGSNLGVDDKLRCVRLPLRLWCHTAECSARHPEPLHISSRHGSHLTLDIMDIVRPVERCCLSTNHCHSRSLCNNKQHIITWLLIEAQVFFNKKPSDRSWPCCSRCNTAFSVKWTKSTLASDLLKYQIVCHPLQ